MTSSKEVHLVYLLVAAVRKSPNSVWDFSLVLLVLGSSSLGTVVHIIEWLVTSPASTHRVPVTHPSVTAIDIDSTLGVEFKITQLKTSLATHCMPRLRKMKSERGVTSLPPCPDRHSAGKGNQVHWRLIRLEFALNQYLNHMNLWIALQLLSQGRKMQFRKFRVLNHFILYVFILKWRKRF